jgi:hypothetical protein
MRTVNIKQTANNFGAKSALDSLKNDLESHLKITFLGVLPIKDLKVNTEKIENKNFKPVLLYANQYWVIALYHVKSEVLSYNFDLIAIKDNAQIGFEINLSGDYLVNFKQSDYAFSCNMFDADSDVLVAFYNYTKQLNIPMQTKTDPREKWLSWASQCVLYGLISIFIFWIAVGVLKLAYEHVNESSRVFIIATPFAILYSFLKGTVLLKILYFLSFAGVIFLSFLGFISSAKKGRQILEEISTA